MKGLTFWLVLTLIAGFTYLFTSKGLVDGGTILVMLLAVVALVAYLRWEIEMDSRSTGHEEQDSECIYWTGDRAGYDVHARCPICHHDERTGSGPHG